MDRLARKFETARRAVPAPLIDRPNGGAAMGIITLGSCDAAVREAVDRLREDGQKLDYMRIRAFPFGEEVSEFLASHERCFVVEQNRDAQLRSLLQLETGVERERLASIREYGGMPMSAQRVADGVTEHMKKDAA
jgi:2-oxoglutarate ferredoxin oxidoreductase subunit alpha